MVCIWRHVTTSSMDQKSYHRVNRQQLIFRESYQPFLRIKISDQKGRVNQESLRPSNQKMPTKIVIRNDGYKRFQNMTVQTKVCFQIGCKFLQLQFAYNFTI